MSYKINSMFVILAGEDKTEQNIPKLQKRFHESPNIYVRYQDILSCPVTEGNEKQLKQTNT